MKKQDVPFVSVTVLLPIVLTEMTRRMLISWVIFINFISFIITILVVFVTNIFLKKWFGSSKIEIVTKLKWINSITNSICYVCIFQHFIVALIQYMCRYKGFRVTIIDYKLIEFNQLCTIISFSLCLLAYIEYLFSNKPLKFDLVNSLQDSMDNYLFNKDSKKFFDLIQSELKCCGVGSYSNWHTNQKLVSIIDTNQISPVPFSCCRVDALVYCDPKLFKNDSVIYFNGCLDVLDLHLNQVFQLLIVLFAIVSGVQLSTIIILQYYRTSLINSRCKGHVFCTEFGWLWGEYMRQIVFRDELLTLIRTLGLEMAIKVKKPFKVKKEMESERKPEKRKSVKSTTTSQTSKNSTTTSTLTKHSMRKTDHLSTRNTTSNRKLKLEKVNLVDSFLSKIPPGVNILAGILPSDGSKSVFKIPTNTSQKSNVLLPTKKGFT